jgi:hypothetical protein
MYLRPASIEEANHWSLRTYVLRDLERQHGGLGQHLSNIYMLDHLFETYGNITSVDLEINFEHMR